jgi:hypothetical protein
MQIIGGQTLFAQGRVKTLPYRGIAKIKCNLFIIICGKEMAE